MKKSVVFYSVLVLFFASCTHQPAPTNNVRVPSSNSSEQRADSECFVGYVQAAGRCNTSSGDDDIAFNRCLGPVKIDLKRCCQVNQGSADCMAVAAPLSKQEQQAIDDNCFVAYQQAAGRCNSSSSTDNDFLGCLRPVKTQLKTCCAVNGGSASCAADAQ